MSSLELPALELPALELPALELPALRERRSLRDEVAVALRAALVSGQMRPGHVYSARMLAAQFGVSATPVREAMLDLVKEGLVVTAPNKGFRVRELSARELDELTEIRRLLEVPATVKVIDVASPDDVTALRCLAQENVDAALRKDLIAFVESDRLFHLRLLGLGANQELVALVGALRSRARLYGIGRLAETGQLGESAHEHLRLLEFMTAGDKTGVAALMEHHLSHVRGDNA